MDKLFKLRQFLSVEDAARRLSFTFQEEVLPKDVLYLVLENRLQISWIHPPLYVEEVAPVTGLYGQWFGAQSVNHRSFLSIEELFSETGSHDLQCIFEHWIGSLEGPEDDDSFTDEEDMRLFEEWWKSKEFEFERLKEFYLENQNKSSHELIGSTELSEDQKELLGLISSSQVFRSRQDYYWHRFGPAHTAEIALVLDLEESKSHRSGLIPVSEVNKVAGGVDRISAYSSDMGEWLWALINEKTDEFSASIDASRSYGDGMVLERPDKSLVRVRENPRGKFFYRDDEEESPRITPNMEELVFLNSDIMDFESTLDSSLKVAGENSQFSDANPLEKISLLKMVLGMAMSKYDYKPNNQRNAATGENRGSIAVDLQTRGLDVDADTIRKHLQAAKRFLPDKTN